MFPCFLFNFLAFQTFIKIFVCLFCFVFIYFLVFEFFVVVVFLKKFSFNHKSQLKIDKIWRKINFK